MFGYIMRSSSSEITSAQLALLFAVESDKMFIGRLGRPRMNLFSVLNRDLNERNLNMNDVQGATNVGQICMATDYSIYFKVLNY